jgi:hypothetical protein
METNSIRHLYIRDINCGSYSRSCCHFLSRFLNEHERKKTKELCNDLIEFFFCSISLYYLKQ